MGELLAARLNRGWLFRWFYADLVADGQQKSTGGVTLIYGKAKAPVRVRDQDEVPILRGSEALYVPCVHNIIFINLDLQRGIVLEVQVLLHCGEPGVPEAVDVDYLCHEPSIRLPVHSGEVD